MATITEDYVSFKTAVQLKEKGFESTCNGYYDQYKVLVRLSFCSVKDTFKSPFYFDCIPAPTLQMAMKWLREVHNIHIEICLYKTNPDDTESKKSRLSPYYTFEVWNTITGNNIDKRLMNDFIGNSYEEAAEEAVKYCLENLI